MVQVLHLQIVIEYFFGKHSKRVGLVIELEPPPSENIAGTYFNNCFVEISLAQNFFSFKVIVELLIKGNQGSMPILDIKYHRQKEPTRLYKHKPCRNLIDNKAWKILTRYSD